MKIKIRTNSKFVPTRIQSGFWWSHEWDRWVPSWEENGLMAVLKVYPGDILPDRKVKIVVSVDGYLADSFGRIATFSQHDWENAGYWADVQSALRSHGIQFSIED